MRSTTSAEAIQSFLAKHGKTQRDFAEGAGLWLSQASAITNGSDPRAKTADKVLRYFRTLDESVRFEDFWGTPEPKKRSRKAVA